MTAPDAAEVKRLAEAYVDANERHVQHLTDERVFSACERTAFGETNKAQAALHAAIDAQAAAAQALRDEVARLQSRLERTTTALDHVRLQAGAWKQEATTQRGTVLGVGEALGGLPDYGPIVAAVTDLVSQLAAERADAAALRRGLDLLAGLHQCLTTDDPEAGAQAIFDAVMSERAELQREANNAREMLERFHAARVAAIASKGTT